MPTASEWFSSHGHNAQRSVALIANGAMHNFTLMAAVIKTYEWVVAVDGGLRRCKQMGIRPNLIIGDFDSAASGLLAQYADVPTERYPIEKNETDLELAITAANNAGADRIGIFGALEKRTDHALYNLHLMTRFPHKIVIETAIESIFTLTNNNEIKCSPGQLISLIPFGTIAKGVSTKGLKWDLNDTVLDKNCASISNMCLSNSILINIREGELICCLARIKDLHG